MPVSVRIARVYRAFVGYGWRRTASRCSNRLITFDTREWPEVTGSSGAIPRTGSPVSR
jgi:hypothetical protein